MDRHERGARDLQLGRGLLTIFGVGLVALVSGGLAVATGARVDQLNHPVAAWTAMADAAPDQPQGWVNLALAAIEAHEFDVARAAIQRGSDDAVTANDALGVRVVRAQLLWAQGERCAARALVANAPAGTARAVLASLWGPGDCPARAY